jgi:hypothetical protein
MFVNGFRMLLYRRNTCDKYSSSSNPAGLAKQKPMDKSHATR